MGILSRFKPEKIKKFVLVCSEIGFFEPKLKIGVGGSWFDGGMPPGQGGEERGS